MKIQFAHIHIQGTDVAIFDAKPVSSSDANRASLLAQLTARARHSGLKVDKSALAYNEGGRTVFYGTPDLVRYLQQSGVPRWTHSFDV